MQVFYQNHMLFGPLAKEDAMPDDMRDPKCLHCTESIDISSNPFVHDGLKHGYVHSSCLEAWEAATPEGEVLRK